MMSSHKQTMPDMLRGILQGQYISPVDHYRHPGDWYTHYATQIICHSLGYELYGMPWFCPPAPTSTRWFPPPLSFYLLLSQSWWLHSAAVYHFCWSPLLWLYFFPSAQTIPCQCLLWFLLYLLLLAIKVIQYYGPFCFRNIDCWICPKCFNVIICLPTAQSTIS